MRSKRLIRNRGRRKKISAVDVDITSLLDILVIVLVFLLKNFNASGVVLNVSKDIALPHSQSASPNNAGVIIQVSADTLWLDDQVLVDDYRRKKQQILDKQNRRIIPLYNQLIKKKKEIELNRSFSKQAKEFSGIVNLAVDKDIPYSFIKKLLFTCAEAGFRQYKFVVRGTT